MLPKSNRLNLKFQFKEIISGKKLATKFSNIYIKYLDNTKPRIGIALSSKNFKKATERNRAKRLTSFALEQILNKLPANINILVIPKSNVLEVKSGEVLKEYEEIFSKLN